MTEFRTSPLGSTGMDITRVGFGSWAIGGGGWVFGWGAQDDDDSVAAIRRAIELGVNWVDTAAAYGFGHSEEVLARALKDFPESDRPYVFTKCGVLANPAGPMEPTVRSGRRATVLSEVDASLRRLGVERIDLYQMHWSPPDAPVEEYWTTMLELQATGKVRACGLSNHSVELLGRAEAIGHVASAQPPFSLVKRTAASDVIPWCVAHGTGVIVYSPMQAGLLTGAFSKERMARLASDDWRRRDAEFQSPRLEATLALCESLGPVAVKHEVTLAEVAIAWTLSFEGVTGAIVGSRRAEQVEGWIGAASLELDEDDLSLIESAIQRSGAGDGPTSPRSEPD